jgi:hypothetical protein
LSIFKVGGEIDLPGLRYDAPLFTTVGFVEKSLVLYDYFCARGLGQSGGQNPFPQRLELFSRGL